MLLLSASSVGCMWVEDRQDLESYVRAQQARPVGKIEPLPTFKPYESFVYEGSSLRDPFKALVKGGAREEAVQDDGIKPDLSRPKDYLEEFSVDELNMVGVITRPGEKELWALIKDPNREVHRVREGDHLGNDFGKIVSIDERNLELVEIISNGRGGWMQRQRTLSLELEEQD